MSQASPIRSISSRAERASFVTHDAAFGAVRGAAPRLARVVETDAHEGPVYVPGEDALYFTSLPRPGQVPAPGFPRVRVARIALDGDRFPLEPDRVSTVRENANVANGMALDLEGRLVACERGTRSQHAAVTRTATANGAVGTLVDEWGGLRLNSPNDVVAKSDGTSGSRIRAMAISRAFGLSRRSATTSTGSIRGPRTSRSSRTRSTSRTGSRSPPTSRSCTSATAEPTRSPGAFTPGVPTTSRPSTWWTAAGWRASACSASRRPASRRDQGRRLRARVRVGLQRRAGLLGRRGPDRGDRASRSCQLHLRRPRSQRPLHHGG